MHQSPQYPRYTKCVPTAVHASPAREREKATKKTTELVLPDLAVRHGAPTLPSARKKRAHKKTTTTTAAGHRSSAALFAPPPPFRTHLSGVLLEQVGLAELLVGHGLVLDALGLEGVVQGAQRLL